MLKFWMKIDYLECTYGGSTFNELTAGCFFCYTIFDIEKDMYYSGSRGTAKSTEHDLLKNYFTSSKTKDFKFRLRNNRTNFKFRIEYFKSREEAFLAEEAFHRKYDVQKNPSFYNAVNASAKWGEKAAATGTVLCLDQNGKSYRVSIDEYKSGRHKHISSERMNVRSKDGSMKKIYVKDFNPEIHTTQFAGHVSCIDKETGLKRRIPKDEFISSSRFVGLTSGKAVLKNLITGKNETIPVHKIDKNVHVGATSGKTCVRNKETGVKITINSADYDREKYKHLNKGKVAVFSLSLKKNIQINVDEFNLNRADYANTGTKVFFKFDGAFLKSRKELENYYYKKVNKHLPRIKAHLLSTFDPNIEVISKDEYCKN